MALRFAIGGSNTATLDIPTPILNTQPVTNPYKGLRAFEEADADEFFGRDVLVHKLVERLETPTIFKKRPERIEIEPYRFLAVIGPSGSGKSSVVKAGIIPALRRGFLPGSSRWIITQMTPNTKPMEQLENELINIAARPIKNLHERLNSGPNGLKNLIPDLMTEPSGEVLLVVDQFEEIFMPAVHEEERVLFMDSLRYAVTTLGSHLRVIITLRADFYDRPLRYAGFGALLQKRTEVVLPLSPKELSQAITGPAERVGITVEPGLEMEIALQVADQPGALPLLQYALTELFDRREGHMMTRAAYHSLGGVLGALTRRAEEVFRTLTPDQQHAAKLLFQRLVTLGEGAQDTRRRALRAELDSLTPEMSHVIDLYGKARLLSFDRDPMTRAPVVEVAHEAIIREWKTLREWLSENRESIRLQQHLTLSAQEWHEQNRDLGDLYRGARLAQIKEWAETHPAEMNPLEREFLSASIALTYQEAAEREEQHKRELETAKKLAESEKIRAEEHLKAASRLRARGRYLMGALILSMLLFAAAAWFGMQAQHQRDQAQQSFTHSERLRLAAQAGANLLSGIDIETAPLLSLASLKMGYTPEADATLQRAMTFIYPAHIFSSQAGAVYAVAISPDSKYAVTTSTESAAILWDVVSGREVRRFTGHKNSVASVAFSPNGSRLVTGGDDSTVRTWEIASGKELRRFSVGEGMVWSVGFSPDGKSVAAIDYNKVLWVWNTETGEILLDIELPTLSSGLAYSPDGKKLLIAGDDNIARLYDTSSGDLLREFSGHEQAVINVAYSHSGQFIATCSDDKTARIWDVETGKEVKKLEGHTESIYGVAFSSDDRYVLTSGYDRVAILWDVESGVAIRRFIGHQGSLYGGAISADDKWILTAGFDGTARLWPSGIQPDPRSFRHTSSIVSLAISPDGKTLASGTTAGQAALWDTATGKKLHELVGHTYTVESIVFSPDGKHIATAADDQSVRIWDAASGEQINIIEGFPDIVWAIRFSPDGKYALTAEDGGLKLWDWATGESIRVYNEDKSFYTAAFSPDGKTILGGAYNGYYVYDTETGNLLSHQDVDGKHSYYAAAISPDGRYATLGGEKLTLFEYPSMKTIASLEGHTGAMLSATFSPDSKLLLSSSEDGTARIWDVATAKTIRIFSGLQALANSAAFSIDGKRLYLAGSDNAIWMWDVGYQELVTYACKFVGRDMTAPERQRYNIADTSPVCP
jgi:WD40 repeat protein/energy-coupling factor transporter ATP-binding protein EcfA2